MSFWGSVSINRAYLTTDHRIKLNDLVKRLNTKIMAAVDQVTQTLEFGEVRYIDIDLAFENHRFCEPGVLEPNNKRPDTWFFLLTGPDTLPSGNLIDQPDGGDPVSPSPEDCDAILKGEAPPLGDPFGMYLICAARKGIAEGNQLADWLNVTDNLWLPEAWAKAFHPKSNGHHGIVEKIEKSVRENPPFILQPVLVIHQGDSRPIRQLGPRCCAEASAKQVEEVRIQQR